MVMLMVMVVVVVVSEVSVVCAADREDAGLRLDGLWTGQSVLTGSGSSSSGSSHC